MQNLAQLHKTTEKILSFWYLGGIAQYKQHAFYDLISDEIRFFFADITPPSDRYIQVLSTDQMFWADKEDVLCMEMTFQRPFIIGMAYVLAAQMSSIAHSIRRNRKAA